MSKTLDFEDFLKSRNFKFTLVEDNIEFVESDSFYLRIRRDANEVDVAPRKNFDRWANSTEYTCQIPYTLMEMLDFWNVVTELHLKILTEEDE